MPYCFSNNNFDTLISEGRQGNTLRSLFKVGLNLFAAGDSKKLKPPVAVYNVVATFVSGTRRFPEQPLRRSVYRCDKCLACLLHA
jgi:hypothetical protein